MSKMSKAAKDELIAAIKRKAKGQIMEKEGKMLSKAAGDDILAILVAHGLEDYHAPGLGVVKLRVNRGSTINGDKLRVELLTRGVSVDVVNEALEEATKRWESQYPEFKSE